MSGILKKPTVLAGIVSIAVSAVSLFLPWIIPDFMEEAESVDFFALLREPDLNTFTAIMIVGLVLNLAFCLGGIAKAAAIFGLIDLAMGLFYYVFPLFRRRSGTGGHWYVALPAGQSRSGYFPICHKENP